MIQFLFATLGAWVIWVIYIVINTLAWAICMEHWDDMISNLADEEEIDVGEFIFAAGSWLFFPIILVVILFCKISVFIINQIVEPGFKKFLKALLKIIPKFEFKVKFKGD
jgi:hypothetical protein